MASYEKGTFQRDFNKYAGSSDLSKAPKSMIKERELSEKRKHRMKLWTTFYRRNVHRFVEHYFGIKLFPYQKIWIYMMGKSDVFMAIGSRSIAKSWLIGAYALAMGTLYPGSKIVIAAGSMEQAGLIVKDKIKGDFQRNYPNVAREIKNIVSSKSEHYVELHNGTTIKVIPAADTARGNRSTLNIYEEFRIIKKEVKDSILAPFLFSRQPPYLKNPEYAHLIEEPKEIYISSAW